MKLVSQALVEKVSLKKWDESGDTNVWIKQARFSENSRMRSLFSQTKIQYMPDESQIEIHDWPASERIILMCWLTFEDADIQTEDPADKSKHVPLFKKGMSESEFRTAFAVLDDTLVNDWMQAVLKMNPHWSWFKEEMEGN